MLPIAPLDYERYAVAHSPLLVAVAEAGYGVASVRTRNTEPVAPATTTQGRRKPVAQYLSKQTESGFGAEKSEDARRGQPYSINSQLPVELSSITGIPPEVLFAAKKNSALSAHAVSELYEMSGRKSVATINVSG